MFRSLVLWRLDVEEKKLGASLDYLRHMLRVSVGAFLKFAKVASVAGYRRALPVDAHAVAGIVASRNEDCGPCVQIGVNMAKASGVSTDVLRAVLDSEPDNLPADLALVYRFAEAVVTANGKDEELRGPVRDRYGERGLVELALAIATSRVFPITKRALGYALSCSEVELVV
ncbi:MAG: carboxymuconolactone decarboxylase family protein [Planctomycetota bacterium]|jgi:alkylhydroperoxidase family enzyme